MRSPSSLLALAAALLGIIPVAMLLATDASAETAKKSVLVTIGDKGCEPTELTVSAGKTSFKIKNASHRGVEWEILKGNKVVAEREDIVPGFVSTLTTKLDAGEYATTCGLRSNPKGRLIVTDAR